jgi:AcrR family transcriptional regulator
VAVISTAIEISYSASVSTPAVERAGRDTSTGRRSVRGRGRRPGRRRDDGGATRQQILEAARSAFGENGYNATTLRAIAAQAEVDVALVAYYFGRKEQLFAAVMDVPVSPGDIIDRAFAGGLDGVGPRLVDLFLGVWEDPESGPAVQALFRGATAREDSRRALSEFVSREVIGRCAAHLAAEPLAAEPRPDAARRRASLAATQLLGMAIMRYVVQADPVVVLRREDIVRDLGRTVQHYLTGPLASEG